MDDQALPIAIEARSEAKAAHHRLDRMNGSIDRLGDEVAQTKKEMLSGIAEVSEKVNAILLTQASEAGEAKARRGFALSRRYVFTTVIVLLTSGTAELLLNLLFRRHK